ncbi:MAG: metalloregulator ArsR/SmtB family transcription factor [Phycisphaerales bacterium]
MKRSANPNPITDRLVAISDSVRLRLCRVLEQEELSVGEASNVVQLPQSTVSRHLKTLAESGWLQKRSAGTSSMYRMVLDDLPDGSSEIWTAVRNQVADELSFAEDARRLKEVVAERKTDTIAFFGRLAGEWDQLRHELFGDTFTSRALLAMLPHDWVIADIGSGTGNAAEHLARHVKQVICIDQSKPMLDAAAKRLAGLDNVRFVEGGAEKLPLKDASVDAVTCLLVLHHIDDVDQVMREFARVIRPGGVALIVDMHEHDRDEYRQQMGHAHLGFSEARIRSMYTDAGFDTPAIASQATHPDARGPGLFVAVARKSG